MIVIPLFSLTISLPYTGYYLFFRVWYGRLYHGNIQSDFGLFKYIFVTPQSHRTHHSLEPQHYDQNFGVIFSIWDYLFHTQYRRYDEYPHTGISDYHFPVEQKSQLPNLWKTFWAQLVYPFLNLRY